MRNITAPVRLLMKGTGMETEAQADKHRIALSNGGFIRTEAVRGVPFYYMVGDEDTDGWRWLTAHNGAIIGKIRSRDYARLQKRV